MASEPEAASRASPSERPLAHLLVYRSAILAGDTGAVEALGAALRERGIDSLVLAVSSLKDPEAVAKVRRAIRCRRPDVIVTTTAFSSRDDAGFVLDEADCPILQAIPVGSAREAWEASPRGLSAADLAMQVALPEFDGRIAAGPDLLQGRGSRRCGPRLRPPRAGAGPGRHRRRCRNRHRLGAPRPNPTRSSGGLPSSCPITRPVADAPVSPSASTPRPAPARFSTCSQEAGYESGRDFAPDELMPRLTDGEPSFRVPLSAYRTWLDTLPRSQRAAIHERWGRPEDDPAFTGDAFRFRAVRAERVRWRCNRTEGMGRTARAATTIPIARRATAISPSTGA